MERYLRRANIDSRRANNLYQDIFGEGGLTSSDSPEQFEQSRLLFESEYEDILQSSNYLRNFLDRIKRNLVEPSFNHENLSADITNNDSGLLVISLLVIFNFEHFTYGISIVAKCLPMPLVFV